MRARRSSALQCSRKCCYSLDVFSVGSENGVNKVTDCAVRWSFGAEGREPFVILLRECELDTAAFQLGAKLFVFLRLFVS